MSSILWYSPSSGGWVHYNAGNLLGVGLLAQVRTLLKEGDADKHRPIYGWLDNSWWRIDVLYGEYNGDRHCEDNEVPEEVRMKNLLIGD